MGGGKTVITLTAIAELIRDGVIDRALIVAPRAVALNTWEQEARGWTHTEDLDIRVALGSPSRRAAVVESQPQVLVLTYDNLQWFAKRYADNAYPLIVMDEITRFNKATGKRYRAFKPFLERAAIRWGLTGSLGADNVEHIFNPVRAVDLGAALGRTLDPFRGEFFIKGQWSWDARPGAADAIARRIAHLVYQPSESVYQSQLPAIQFIDHEYAIESDDVYQQLMEDFVFEDITVASAGVLVGKLQQCASGFLYREDGSAEYLDYGRIERLTELVNEAAGSPVLIWYWFEHSGELLRDQGYVDLLPNLEAWNRGEIPVAICHPRSGGHGVNAQAGGYQMIWYEHTWSAEERAQAVARLYRQGQKQPVVVHDIVGTYRGEKGIDAALLMAQGRKRNVAEVVASILEK